MINIFLVLLSISSFTFSTKLRLFKFRFKNIFNECGLFKIAVTFNIREPHYRSSIDYIQLKCIINQESREIKVRKKSLR